MLNPFYVERFHLLEGVKLSADILNDPEILDRLRRFQFDGPWSVPDTVAVSDLSIPGSHGDIPIRVYRPRSPSKSYVLWIHGGGFAAGELDWPESHSVSAELASRTGATVVAVDYRLAGPQSRYPVPLDDVVAAFAWLSELARHEAGSSARIVVGGASAGAALALAATIRQPGHAAAVLLAYPVVHFPVPSLPHDFVTQLAVLPPMLRFTPDSIAEMVRGYVGRIQDVPDLAFPGHSPLLTSLPPTYILTSEYDDLRPSGELLERQLEDAGVPVRSRLERGVVHGHLNQYPGGPGVVESLDWLASAVATATLSP